MKTIAVMALLYGKPYIQSAIRSVIDAVSELWILYTPMPSHGTRQTALPNPDTHDELLALATQAAGSKLRWRAGVWHGEGYQRDSIYRFAPDADIILTVDSDEIWLPSQLELLLRTARAGTVRQYLAYEMPFWRSFWRAIPDRLCAPTRAVNTQHALGTQATDASLPTWGTHKVPATSNLSSRYTAIVPTGVQSGSRTSG